MEGQFSFHNTSASPVARVLTSVSASLSMLGAVVIIATYITWQEIRSSPRKILVYISIADFFTAFGNMFSVLQDANGTDRLCKAQSFITTCSSLWSFFWTTFLAIYLYCSVALKKPLLAGRLFLFFTFFGWGIPVVITGIALGYGVLGDDKDQFSAGWCWINSNTKQQLFWMLFTGKAWEIATYILVAVFYTALKCYIHKDVFSEPTVFTIIIFFSLQITYKHEDFTSTASQQSAIKAERKLILIPVVFIFLRIWGTLRFILLQTNIHEKLTFLLYLQGIGDSAQGFANFLLFCFFTEKFQRKLGQFCCSWRKPRKMSINGSYDDQQTQEDYSAKQRVKETSPLLSSMERHHP